MYRCSWFGMCIAGAAAGLVTGLFGGGGGMVLVPLLGLLTSLEEEAVFPTSISIILPICLVSLGMAARDGSFYFKEAIPYLIGSTLGGIIAGKYGKYVPVLWLHRILGILILWGGYRYLC